MPSFSAVLLAGGESSRMGRDKALLPAPGTDLLLWQRQLAVLEALKPNTIFWSGSFRPGLPDHVRVIADTIEKSGPLGGVSAALDALQSDLLVVLAIDLPQMTSAFLKKLVDSSSAACGAVGTHEGFWEPLAAVYPRNLQSLAKKHLQKKCLAMQDFITEAVRRKAMQSFPLTGEEVPLFRNLNRPQDLVQG